MASRFLSPFGGRGLTSRGDPFLDLHREVNRLFDDTFRGMGNTPAGQGLMQVPRIDVHQAGQNLEVSAELPGVAPEDVDLRLDGDMLTISGEKRQEYEDKQAHVVERSYGSFSRSVQLPFSPNPDQVRADFDKGVLRITLPQQESQERSRRIQIGKAQRQDDGTSSQSSRQTSGQSGGDDPGT